jgi:glycosyltransferase involved in cell wall biosynthesis
MPENNLFLVFDNLKDEHLSKDVGELISDSDGTTFRLSYIYTSSKNVISQTKNLTEIVNLKNSFFPRISIRLAVLLKIKAGDFLLLYHGGLVNYIFASILRLLKPQVRIIMKLDMDELTVGRIQNKSGYTEKTKYLLRKLIGSFIDVYLVETQFVYKKLSEIKPFMASVSLIPNGIKSKEAYRWDTKKEDIILVIGRIGACQKNHELLLKAFSLTKNPLGFKLYFVGPVESNFKRFYEDLCQENPKLRDIVIFTGNIQNKDELYQFYKRAKFISFSSFYEGFSIAMIEAMYFGCYLISTDLAVANDLTLNGTYGKIVPINSLLLAKMVNDGVVDFVKYIHENQAEICHSSWFENSVALFASTLDEVISHSFDISNARENSLRIFKEYNWIKIRSVFNETIR